MENMTVVRVHDTALSKLPKQELGRRQPVKNCRQAAHCSGHCGMGVNDVRLKTNEVAKYLPNSPEVTPGDVWAESFNRRWRHSVINGKVRHVVLLSGHTSGH